MALLFQESEDVARERAGDAFLYAFRKNAFNVMMKDYCLALAVVCVHLGPRIFY